VGASREDGPATPDAKFIGIAVSSYYGSLPTFEAMTERVLAHVNDEDIDGGHIRSQAMRGYQLMHLNPHYPYGQGASDELNRTHLHCEFLNRLLEQQDHALDDETRAALVQDHLEQQDENDGATVDEDTIGRLLRYLDTELNREMET